LQQSRQNAANPVASADLRQAESDHQTRQDPAQPDAVRPSSATGQILANPDLALKRGRKPKDAAPAHVAPPKIEAKGDGDLLDALKALKGLVSAHGADKMKSMVDLLS
jgi:hypothetical protein